MRRLAFGRIAALAGAMLLTALSGQASGQSARERVDLMVAEARASMLVDPAAARVQAAAAEAASVAIAEPSTRGTVRATALWLGGEAAYRLKDFAGAMPKLREALTLVRVHAPGSKLESDLLLTQASVHSDTGHVVEALREFQRAFAIAVRLKDVRSQAIALICIGVMYNDAKDHDAALKYFDQALALMRSDPQLSLSILNNRASALRSSGRYAEAERGFRTALTIAETMHSRALVMQILRNIARLQLNQDNVAGAERTVARGMTLAGDADRFSRQAMSAVAAQVAFKNGDRHYAATLVARSFDGVDLTTTPFSFRDAHATAYRVYHAMGEDRLAYAHLLALKRLDDQTTELATSTGAALMTARFDFANQELKITRLKADDLERRIVAGRQRAVFMRWVFYGGAAATAIVIAALLSGLIVVRRSRDRVRAANDDLALANDALGKALAAKTEFLATTSHEIRTPLNGILGMTQVMLADGALPEATRERLTVVQAAGTTMRTLVDDILDVAKMENGKLVLEHATFDLKATITDATRLWDIQAGAKGIAFRRELDACPVLVSGDAARVRQLVFNLLSNALKFTESGEIAISAHPQDDGQIVVAVRDSGIGIPADKLEAIFESFRQADAGTTRRFGGTGLGLAICRQLARAMGGDVAVESRVGEGSVFTVTLPLPCVTPDCDEAAAGQGAPALLIVERNPIARSLLRTLLQPHVERIVFASGADEAVTVLRADRVSQVLVEETAVAVGGDSADGLGSIAAAAAGSARVSVLTAAIDDASRDALLATGIDCIIAKPVTGPLLVATLFRQGNDLLVRQAA